MARVGEGDARAFEELLHRYQRGLTAFLDRQTGGRDVEDLFQETWLRVARAAASFDRTRRFSTWLFQIAVNLCRDRARRTMEEPAGELAERIPSNSGDQNAVEASLDAAALLAKLPAVQREALVLRFYHDIGESEMSEILGCPRGTVKSRIHGALVRLNELVGERRR